MNIQIRLHKIQDKVDCQSVEVCHIQQKASNKNK